MPVHGRGRYPQPPTLDGARPWAAMPAAGLSGSWASCAAATAGRAGSRYVRSCRWRRAYSAPSYLTCHDPAVTRHNAHPPILLKVKDRLIGIWCYRPLRWCLRRERCHVVGLDDPRRFRTGLQSIDVTTLDHAQRRHLVHADDLGRGIERDLSALGPFAVAVACDFVMAAEAAHALVSPTIAVAGRFTAT